MGYYDTTTRLGEKVTILSRQVSYDAFEEFNADLIKATPVSCSVTASYTRINNASSYIVNSSKFDKPNFQMEFYVGGEDKKNTERHVAELVGACRECTITLGDTADYTYKCVLTSVQDTDTEVDFFHKVVLTFACVKCFPNRAYENLSGTFTVYNPGAVPVPVYLALTFTQAFSEFTFKVGGVAYTLKNVKSGDIWQVNGQYQGSVAVSGANRLEDTDIYTLPVVQAGDNKIELPTGCTGSVYFQPVFM